jgi:hypothetical protein
MTRHALTDLEWALYRERNVVERLVGRLRTDAEISAADLVGKKEYMNTE